MAKTKPTKYRRKNRQMKFTVDVPDEYSSDEDFMNDFMDKLDSVDWKLQIGGSNNAEHDVFVNKVALGDIDIEPEE